MVELGKRDKGVTLFDLDALAKVDITGQRNSDFQVYFDTHAYDELRGSSSNWFIYSFNLLRAKNPEICMPFDEFFTSAYELVKENRQIFEKYSSFGSNKGILRQTGGTNLQINYPSDDDSFTDGTMLGVTKHKELGYSLNFNKTSKDLTNLSFLLKNGGSHFDELARLYAECFAQLCDLAIKPYEECQEEFNRAYTLKRNPKPQ